ncbi:hypothetical protein [Komagataeibacter xylinus]|uniref:hypothetical protein n=1 Tax=Komagataeibacter xylinus TaxID=28448 RepID=UPI001013D665|nr:hypothetical protein [Komagataeibacter xylinus]
MESILKNTFRPWHLQRPAPQYRTQAERVLHFRPPCPFGRRPRPSGPDAISQKAFFQKALKGQRFFEKGDTLKSFVHKLFYNWFSRADPV